MTGLLRAFVVVLALLACAGGASAPRLTRGRSAARPKAIAASAPSVETSQATLKRYACRVARSNEGCRAGSPRRPVHVRSPNRLFSTDGRVVFYYRQRTDFDPRSLLYATVTDCPLWEDVFAWDGRDVYVLWPESCGGENCGGDYTGYSWGGMSVRHLSAFHWLPAGYGADGRFVYSRWHDGPLAGARPAHFEVILCGDERHGFAVGREGDHFYRDGKQVTEAEAFNPAWPGDGPRPRW